ncbi:hypothetical protein PV797_10965 [Clostridiaceae bacterium M8S5]|nr:hypothetical protein PV797_10965 [Clostridiaceae bacterium M8S5]
MKQKIFNDLSDIIERHKKIDDDIYESATLLLKNYLGVVWSNFDSYDDAVREHSEVYGTKNYSGLEIMSQLGAEKKAREIMNKLLYVAENKMMLDVIEKALAHVKEYPDIGELYYDIINKNFLSDHKCNQEEICDSLHMGRTTYYRRRKEAIYLFGVSLWEYSIPSVMN